MEVGTFKCKFLFDLVWYTNYIYPYVCMYLYVILVQPIVPGHRVR